MFYQLRSSFTCFDMAANKAYKSILFEYCQKKRIGPPYFNTVIGDGEFAGYQSEVTIDGTMFGYGTGFLKKKEAENDAAMLCLTSLGLLAEPNKVETTEQAGEELQSTELATSAGSGQSVSDPSGPSPGNNTVNNVPSTPPGFSSLGHSPATSIPMSKKPKSILHEYCQKAKMSLPQYDSEEIYHGNKLCGYTCVLTLNEVIYDSGSIFPSKRDAEHAAAAKALVSFSPARNNTQSPFYTGSQRSFASPPSGSPISQSSPGMMYKNLLQEHLRQRNLDNPRYDSNMTGAGYCSTVTFEGKVLKSLELCSTKKLAEQSAAKAALIELGIKDPDKVALQLLRRISPFRIPDSFPFKTRLPTGNEKDSWIHRRSEMTFDTDDYGKSGYTDFEQPGTTPVKRSHDSMESDETPNKRQRVGESSESRARPSRRGNDFEIADAHLGNLTVGEIWPEKKNVVIVGSNETSIPLYCNGAYGKCALEDKTISSLVDILPGHRLVGLEGHYIERGGQIVLRAKQCQEIIMPAEPDKVLVSCGVVVLHCIPKKGQDNHRCDVNILLKRYLCSQAFINVARGLSQVFRIMISQRPLPMNIISSIVEYVTEWTLEEVMAISTMTADSLQNVFKHTMRFDRRWKKVLHPEDFPEELKKVQTCAQNELSRRSSAGEDQNQDRYRPWQLPKGNFHHRILSTGVFIESPAECAMRELLEETGIRLKLNDIASSPYVDLFQADNLNPHKGDVARYYLCGIITDAEDKTEGTKLEQSIEELQENPSNDPAKTTEAKTPDKSVLSSEEANVIRSPSVSGALHEECTWYDVEIAKDISQIFCEVYKSDEFQKILSTLKKIVSEM